MVTMSEEISLPDNESITIFLTRRFGAVSNVKVTRLGAGVHGVGYRIDYKSQNRNREERVILKTLLARDFGHDHLSDRAAVHLLANQSYSELPNHVKCLDIVGYDDRDLISVKKCSEFFIIMGEARGTEYFRDFKKILGRGDLTEEDRRKADDLATYLAGIHKKKYYGDNASSLYKRKIRDTIGHGECLMGIFDTYSDWDFITREDMVEIVQKSIPHWDRLKDDHSRLCQVHGDFHPGNIWFHGDELVLLDRSRGIWGEPADDVFCLLINYIFYALIEHGSFKGPFSELFHRVYERYTNLTWDTDILNSAPLFLAFRVPVIANPNFYPNVDDTTRKKLIAFAKNVLEEKRFDVRKIEEYVKC